KRIDAHVVVGAGADEAVGLGDDARDPGRATAPGYRPAVTVPTRDADQVVAVAQESDKSARQIPGVGADEAVGGGDDTANPRRAAAPGYRPAVAVPKQAADYVVAVAQDGDYGGSSTGGIAAHVVVGAGADEAVGGGDDAANPRRAAAPGYLPAVAVPKRVSD